MKLKIFKFYPDSIIPQYQTKGAAGFDFCAHLSEPYTMQPGEIHAFDTGVGVEIPDGYELQIRTIVAKCEFCLKIMAIKNL